MLAQNKALKEKNNVQQGTIDELNRQIEKTRDESVDVEIAKHDLEIENQGVLEEHQKAIA